MWMGGGHPRPLQEASRQPPRAPVSTLPQERAGTMVGRPREVGAKCPGAVVPQVTGLRSCPATVRFHTGCFMAWRPNLFICEMGLAGAALPQRMDMSSN